MKLILSNEPSLFSVCLDRTEPQISPFSFEAKPLRPPQNDTTFGPSFGGSCNGLLCLNFPDYAILWNPTSKTHHKIPQPVFDSHFQLRENWRYYVVHGLGYDQINDDFKVVRVYQYLASPDGARKFDTKVLVYSLKANSWMSVADFPHFVEFGTVCDAFVNGCLHFHVSTKRKISGGFDIVESDDMIAAFNVSDYTYKLVSGFDCDKKEYKIELGVLGERLCVIRNYDCSMSQCLVMKEYGVNSSWTELFHVKMDPEDRLFFRPICYLGDEKLVLLEAEDRILCYNVESNCLEDLEIGGVDGPFQFFVCMESEFILGSVDDNHFDELKQVNEENPEGEAVLDSVDGDDCNKLQQVNEEANGKNLERVSAEREVNEENLQQDVNEVNLGNVDGDDCNKVQQANEEVEEENLERVSAKNDIGAT